MRRDLVNLWQQGNINEYFSMKNENTFLKLYYKNKYTILTAYKIDP